MNTFLLKVHKKWIPAAILSFLGVMVIVLGSTDRVLADQSPPIDGYHDYEQVDVPDWACNAGGWAMDPDDPGEHVHVRIVVDESVLTELTAENYRQDLEIAWNEGSGGCPGGACAFG